MKYRYLDLRRPVMQKLILRHKAMMAIRNFFDKLDFVEIETPILESQLQKERATI